MRISDWSSDVCSSDLLIGLDSAPSKGRVSEVGANFLTYEAFTGETGPDAFTYRVRDRLGAEATASIRVGIAPAEAANQAPYAVKDRSEERRVGKRWGRTCGTRVVP